VPARIRKDDEVVVIAGKDKGKTGRVLRVDPVKQRVIVEGVNIVKRHQRPTPGVVDSVAGVIEREAAIHLSNVALLDPTDGKPTRVGTEIHEGRRYRVARRSGTRID
jgi:large subunit ribosomal protein L24